VQFPDDWAKTFGDKNYVMAHKPEWGITVFCTRRNMKTLAGWETLLADGTLKTAPKPYCQLYSLFGVLDGHKIPLLHALLTGKTALQYERLIRIIREKIQSLGIIWEVRNII
jgi:hypothetical protein